MINHEYLELFNQSSIRKDIDMAYDTDNHITNSDVVSGSFSLNESAFATKELRFGSLVSSQLSVKLYNTVPNLMDKQLDVSIVVNNVTSNPLKIGKYKVLEDKPTTDRLYKQIKAYDGLYEVINKNVVEWYEGLSFPLTQKDFRDSFFDYVGITEVDITLINDDMLIEKTITANIISGQQILSAICELNGAIGRMNRDGNFEYVILEVNPSSRITIDKIVSKSGSYEDFDSQPISKVQIRQTTDDIGAIVGENGNTYIVQDNFLVYGKSSADLTSIATNLLSVIEGISYKPFNIKAIYGNPCYEIGDAITVVTKNKTFNSYIFNRTLKGIQAMSDTIKADGVEYYTENLNSANVQIQQLKRQTNELSRTVEETKSTITSIETIAENANSVANNANTVANQANTKADDIAEDLDKNYSTTVEIQSQIKQSADAITSTVSKTYATQESVSQSVNNLQQQIDGAIETFTGSVVPTLSNSPASDWTTDAIKDTHIGDLYIVDSSGGNYAGFYYRFEKSGSTYQWVLLKDNEVTKALQDAKEANEQAQAVANNLANNYSTTAQMNSAIEQSANSITSTVSATYTTKEEFNDLEIGGRNLILNSDNGYLNGLNVFQPAVTPTYGFIDGWWTITYADTTQITSKEVVQNSRKIITESSDYTVSFLVKTDATTLSIPKISFFNFNTTTHAGVVTTVTKIGEGLYKVSATKYLEEGYTLRLLDMQGVTTVGATYLAFRYPKLEKGTKATDWTPAPEDVETRVTTAESSIKQNADNISLKVSKGDVSSQLSVESDQVTISGNRLVVDADNLQIDADGTITATNGNFTGTINSSNATITGGSVNVVGSDENDSKIIVRNSGDTLNTKIAPAQISMNFGADHSTYLDAGIQDNLGTGGLRILNGNYEVGVSGSGLNFGYTTGSSAIDAQYTRTNMLVNGNANANGEFRSTTANGLRIAYGNYGFFIRNDGSATYFLLTASGDQYGSYNSLRPLTINNSTGAVIISNGLTTSTITNTDRITSNYITLHGGLSLGSGQPYIYTSDGNNINFRYTNSAGSTAYTSIQALSVITALKFIKCGTTVISNMTSGATSVTLVTLATVQGWYSGANALNTAIFVTNGDGSANSKHVDGTTYMNSQWYATFDSGTTASAIRINWMLVCW